MPTAVDRQQHRSSIAAVLLLDLLLVPSATQHQPVRHAHRRHIKYGTVFFHLFQSYKPSEEEQAQQCSINCTQRQLPSLMWCKGHVKGTKDIFYKDLKADL